MNALSPPEILFENKSFDKKTTRIQSRGRSLSPPQGSDSQPSFILRQTAEQFNPLKNFHENWKEQFETNKNFLGNRNPHKSSYDVRNRSFKN